MFGLLSTSDDHNVIQNIDVMYSICRSDHIPLCIDISHQVEGSSTQECKQISCDKLSGYADATKSNLQHVSIPHYTIICNDVNSTDDSHVT